MRIDPRMVTWDEPPKEEKTAPKIDPKMVKWDEPTSVSAGKAINRGLSDIPRQIGLTARYGIEGLANTAQIVTEPIANLMRMGGIPTKSTGQAASSLADFIGLPSPQDANERVIGDATRLVAGGGAMAGGSRLASVLPGVTGKVSGLLAANPLQQLSAAGGAGLAGGASREGGGGEGTQAVASILGGVAGGMTPSAIGGTVNAVKRAFTPNMTPQQIDIQLSTVMGTSNYADLPDYAKNVLRKELRSSLQAGRELDPEAVRRLADFASVRGTTPTRGMVTQDPVQITREMNLSKMGANSADGELQGLARIQNDNNRALIGNINDAGANRGDLFASGVRAIGSITGRDNALGQAVTNLYTNARNMPGGNTQLERTGVVNGIYDALAKQNKMAYLPDDIANTLNSISQGQITRNGQTFKVPFDANALDNLMTDIATAQRGTQDGNVKAALKIARDAIDKAGITPVKQTFDGGQIVTKELGDALVQIDSQAPAFMQALNDARGAARGRFAWQESSKPVEAALSGMEPDKFVQKFVIGGSVADAQALAKEAPKAQIKEAILAHLKEKALNGAADEVGKFSQSAFNKALMNIGDRKLNVFFSPEEIAQIKAMGRVASYMQNQPVGSAVNNSNSGALLLGRGIDALNKIPIIGPMAGPALQNINVSLQQRAAQNIAPGLLAQNPRQASRIAPLLLPGFAAGGLLAP